ncbi:MAG: hypothetical protein A4E19_19835 [Nitrospira sp. SG-bin1]|nr:MAG: hypothetical protein A4E19_19835 [Nitrospira sp. SG-bin1]
MAGTDKRKTKQSQIPAAKPDPDKEDPKEDRMRAESTGRGSSGHAVRRSSSQPVAGSKQRQETQRIPEEPSSGLQESEKVLDEKLSASAPNGHDGIEQDSAHRRIAERAFILFQDGGCQHGNDWAHWFEAERQVNETRMPSQHSD